MRTHVRVFDAAVARTRTACKLARSCTTEIAGFQAADAASRESLRGLLTQRAEVAAESDFQTE